MIVRALVDYGDGLHFYRLGYIPPIALSGILFPWLLGVDPLRRAARASHLPGLTSGEIPNTRFTVRNGAGEVSALFAAGLPLRRRAWLFDAGGNVVFTGLVMSLSLDATALFTVEG